MTNIEVLTPRRRKERREGGKEDIWQRGGVYIL